MANCLPFFHRWSEWEDHPEICKQIRKCTRNDCTKTQNRPFHSMGEWVFVPGKCEQVRTCVRCDYQEKRTVDHDFGEWKMIEGKCAKTRACKRCGYEQTKNVSHEFGQWQMIPELCEAERYCKRCGSVERRSVSHEWVNGITSYSSALIYRIEVNENRLKMFMVDPSLDVEKREALINQIALDKAAQNDAAGKSARICKRCLTIEKIEPEPQG